MNNLLKRAAAFTAAAGILFTAGFSVPCEAPANRAEKRELTASVCTAEPVSDRLERAADGTLGETELETLCKEILAEAEQGSRGAGTPACVQGNAELTARQAAHDAELRKRAAKVSILAGRLRSGEATEQELSELRGILYPDAALYQSDATPSEAVPNTAPPMTEGAPVSRAQTLRSDAPSAADLELKGETDIPQALIDKAKELGSANAIYQYLRNNIKYEIYGNSKKGAKVTFEQMGGNDIDQASLLIAMLRGSGIPARYVSGSIEITAQQAMDMTGTKDIASAGRVLAASFDNVSGLTSGGTVTGYRMQHTWAEAYVPYTDYRGAGACAGESIWLPLDVSFKKLETAAAALDMEYTEDDRAKNAEMAALAADYPIYGPVEPLPDQMELLVQSIVPTEDAYLPVTLPYQVLDVTDRYAAVPDSKRSALKIAVGGETLLDAPLSELYGKRIVLTYEPATAADRELLPKNADLTKVPAYLVHVVPVLSVDDETHTGRRELSLGTAQQMLTTVSGDSGDSILSDVVRAGSVYAVTLDYEKIGYTDSLIAEGHLEKAEEETKAGSADIREALGTVLENVGKQYFAYCDFRSASQESLYHVRKNRELGIVITGYEYDTDTTLGVTNALTDGSFMMDVAYNRFRTVSLENDADAEIQFTMSLAMMESYYEGAVWEDLSDNMLSGISTVTVMDKAAELNVPVVSVCAPNADEVLANCTVSSEVRKEVRDCVNKGLFVRLVSQTLNIGDWTGTAYIAIDRETGACSYMLSGGTAGGSTERFEALLNYNLFIFKVSLFIAETNFAVSTMQFKFEQYKMVHGPIGEMFASPAMGQAAKAVFSSGKQIGDAMQMYYKTVSFVMDYAFDPEGTMERLEKFTKENYYKVLEMVRDDLFAPITKSFSLRDFAVGDRGVAGPLCAALKDSVSKLDNVVRDGSVDLTVWGEYNSAQVWGQAFKKIMGLLDD
ncbi:MAG: transglutaminase-like domain-containing protein [Oscillospiraceae bacterium]|nr:transglutaminase-like domain-containing protein [Oscillospiraceae bacterium]